MNGTAGNLCFVCRSCGLVSAEKNGSCTACGRDCATEDWRRFDCTLQRAEAEDRAVTEACDPLTPRQELEGYLEMMEGALRSARGIAAKFWQTPDTAEREPTDIPITSGHGRESALALIAKYRQLEGGNNKTAGHYMNWIEESLAGSDTELEHGSIRETYRKAVERKPCDHGEGGKLTIGSYAWCEECGALRGWLGDWRLPERGK